MKQIVLEIQEYHFIWVLLSKLSHETCEEVAFLW